MKKILLVEAQETMEDNLRGLLLLSNYQVECARDGREGVRAAVAEKPDLIMADAELPVLDGYGVIHALQQYPETRSIPVILMTTLTEKDSFRKAMMAGADDFLGKPFDGLEVLRSVEACLERRRRQSGEHAGGQDILHSGPMGTERGTWHPGDREVRLFKRKTVLYAEGQRVSQVWYIVKGRIKTYLINTEGKELITHIYGPGDCIGYIAALQGGTYTDNAQVLEEAGLIILARSEFLVLLNSDTGLAQQLIRWLAHNASEKEAGLLNLAYNSLRKKVANGILSLFDSFRSERDGKACVTVSRDNLAAIVGSAPESLTRTLSDFKREKLIEVADGKIYLLNEEKLRNMIN